MTMKQVIYGFLLLTFFLSGNVVLYGAVPPDTNYTKKEIRKAKHIEARKELKRHLIFNFSTTYAFLKTQVRFITPQGLLSFQVGLEKNLKMPDKQMFFSGSMVYRITPRSGLYAMYYGLNRQTTKVLQEDIYLPNDTILAGSYVDSYFNTHVYSFGYMYSILTGEKSFLGVFFNVYLMNIKTGIESDIIRNREYDYHFLAPLPNFGMITDFELKKWFHLGGSFGLFFVNSIDGVGGSIQDFHIYTSFYPVDWMAFRLGYQVFNVVVTSREDEYKLNVSYNFKGPSFSLTLRF